MRSLTQIEASELVVGTATGDDAAVWVLEPERALVLTADFITPVVDDARTWGRIAAANAVSDVYAMGARPLMALNLVAWNAAELSSDILSEVLAGGSDIAGECDFVIGGGHSVDDPEPKYGMAVLGEVHPNRILTNAGLRAGDHLVLTKPLGMGIVATAIKAGAAGDDVVEAACFEMMRTNAAAAASGLRHGATAATDVTGFGLLGHGLRMAQESGVDLVIDAGSVPVLDGVRELLGHVPGGTQRNLEWVREHLDVGDGVDEETLTLMADAQTSGGLLLGVVGEGPAQAVVAELSESGHHVAVVGVVVDGTGKIRVS